MLAEVDCVLKKGVDNNSSETKQDCGNVVASLIKDDSLKVDANEEITRAAQHEAVPGLQQEKYDEELFRPYCNVIQVAAATSRAASIDGISNILNKISAETACTMMKVHRGI